MKETITTVYESATVERKTKTKSDTDTTNTVNDIKSGPSKPQYQKGNKRNVLDSYRTYTYIFTLAALKNSALTDPSSYRDNEDYFVIAKSGGKGTTGLIPPKTGSISRSKKTVQSLSYDNDLVTEFNARSPGRFDFYIDNVNIETIMGFDERTSTSVATKIEFDLFEPYSMTGFIEALQVSAVASGHDQYMNTPYLLRMEFFGFPDSADVIDSAQKIPMSERFFVFSFTSVEITVTEEGTRYKCAGVPHNERAFGEPSTVKANMQLQGVTVGEILEDLQRTLNSAKESDTESERGSTGQTSQDTYEIVFPNVDEYGTILSGVNKKFTEAKVLEPLKDNATYKFAEPGDPKQGKYDPKKPVIFFQENAKVQDCIVSIIRDSDYVRELVNEPKVDPYGMVDYFIVNLEVEEKGEYDEKSNKPFYKYRYVVTPYKVHYTKIPMSRKDTIDTSKLISVTNRNYEYLYTGNNVDIRNFNLKFNTLFYQAIPQALGNKKGTPGSVDSAARPESAIVNEISVPKGCIQESKHGRSTVRHNPKNSNVTVGETYNSGKPQVSPYAALAKNLHEAIINNVDQCQIDFEIIGDPFYLVTGSMGNYRPKVTAYGQTEDGEAAYTKGDVLIYIKFRNPIDIDTTTGEAIFDDEVSSYSGIFKVITVKNKFKDGVFTQDLNAIRFEGQITETTCPPVPANKISIVESRPDPVNASTVPPPAPPSTVRASSDSLAASISDGLPVTGAPGELSKFAGASGGELTGFTPGVTSISSLINQVAGGAGGVLNAFSSIGSVIRLASSGLSAISSVINSAGASILQLTNVANSAGITQAAALAGIAYGLTQSPKLSQTSLSPIRNLGSRSAGLVSGVSSKIDSIPGVNVALSTQLGTGVNKLSGLSSQVSPRSVQQIRNAVSSVPSNVDLNTAMQNGLIVENIPVTSFGNIPATQPRATAPLATLNPVDRQFIINQGGNLANLQGIPQSYVSSNGGLDDISVGSKLSTVQSGLNSITGQYSSVEASLNRVNSITSAGVPNTSAVSNSVINKFGSRSATTSPLYNLLRNS